MLQNNTDTTGPLSVLLLRENNRFIISVFLCWGKHDLKWLPRSIAVLKPMILHHENPTDLQIMLIF